MNAHQLDEMLINKIEAYSLADESYWSFKGRSTRQHCHALIQYPAMMVPEMQGELIDAISEIDNNIQTVFDPFVGSGTTLGEAMTRGLNFLGHDINPLAILACEVKSGPLYIKSLKDKLDALLENINNDASTEIAIQFNGIDKWFTAGIQIELSKIYRAIKSEKSKWARKIFWLSLSNTVRATCNSRSSTYKLHIKSEDQIASIPSAISSFKKNLLKNIEHIAAQKELLREKNVLERAKAKGNVKIKNIDTKKIARKPSQCDFLISSPPYGDNQTTVTYGQFSYLPLMWIDLDDIDNLVDRDFLRNQNTIDSSSLGGSLKEAQEKLEKIGDKSPSLCGCISKINEVDPRNTRKLISFIYDLDLSLENAISHLRKDAYMVWTLGNRRISNIEVPLDDIMKELLQSKNCIFVHQLERNILSKRMASRNQIASTMGKESVLIMRR